MPFIDPTLEWREADGLGGFAAGTAAGIRTRRYHALLLAAVRPPADRRVLVNGLEVWVARDGGDVAISSQRYAPDVTHPDGSGRIVEFAAEPWPRWVFDLGGGSRIVHELFVVRGAPLTVLSWRLEGPAAAAVLHVRPLVSGRDFHGLVRENPGLRMDVERGGGGTLRMRLRDDLPPVLFRGNGDYVHAPDWYRNFLYDEERNRGLDHVEDLASPGVFRFDLRKGEAFLALAAEGAALDAVLDGREHGLAPECLRESERERRAGLAPIERVVESYVVRRGSGLTIVAGYPWFGDWGRDTFIALRGLLLATGRIEEAGSVLEEWAGAVSEGMLPNRFPDAGETPEYNSVDASLWYAIGVHEYLVAAATSGPRASTSRTRALRSAVDAILEGYSRGTRFGIRLDDDGLLAAGEPGVQLTWMDARVDGRVITPRIGKPVEIQALWLNALEVASSWDRRWKAEIERSRTAFARRFWNPERGCLVDVVDPEGRHGTVDATLRPNQILAAGGLPWPLVTGERGRAVVDAVERHLLTPLGLRSLAPDEPGYVAAYTGGVADRDGAYHQGTVWPWLFVPFVEAWVRVRGGQLRARTEAAQRFLSPLRAHLEVAGIGHVSEIADADSPHTPRGCPFQAWSLGELLRLERIVLAAPKAAMRRKVGMRRGIEPCARQDREQEASS